MQESLKKLENKPVLGPDLRPVCLVKKAIIDPATGKFLGFTTAAPKGKIVVVTDIMRWQNAGLVLGQEFELTDPEDLPRLAKILQENIKIKGAKVTTVSGQFLGTVTDVFIDTKANMLSAIIVKKKFLKLISYQESTIYHRNIVEISKKGIIVKDALVKIPEEKETVTVPLSEFAT